jgi:putative transposase
MAEPPRLHEILLNSEQAIIYFVTLCVKDRKPVLANEHVFRSIRETATQISRWTILAGVVMPDHVHFVVTPVEERSLAAGDFSTGFKRILRQGLSTQNWEWQRGCFDRLLRSDENLKSKWVYIEQNPVRAGLVQNVGDWRYYLGSIAESPTVGEAVSVPNLKNKDGKLAASPTREGMNNGKPAASPTGELP